MIRPTGDAEQAFAASGFVVLRTPLLAFDELVALGAGLEAAAAARDARAEPAEIDAALAADHARITGRLRALAARPEVREAIYLASPSLDDGLATWLERPDAARDAKVVRAVHRYVARMSARATPFGVLAGVSVGGVATDTRLDLGPRATARKRVHLDAAYVAALTRALGQHPAIGPHAVPAPSLTDDDALAALLAALRCRAVALGADAADLTGWVAELAAAASALAALAAAPPGSPPAAWRSVVEALAGLPERVAHAATLRGGAGDDAHARVLDRVARADAGVFAVLSRGLEVRAARARLAHVVQVDLIKHSPAATVGAAVLDELQRGVELLRRVVPARDPLAAFTAAFAARHGDDEVPLLEVADDDHGIPVPPAAGPRVHEPLLRGLDFAEDAAGEPAPPFGPREAHLLERLHDVLRATRPGNIACLELDDHDVASLAGDAPPPLPDAFAVLAALAADSEQALAAGRFRIHLAHVVGPSGARLLGRFCHGDPRLAEHVASHLRAEEALRPDAIHAEVALIPDGRDGNVVRRPRLRAHYIAVADRASAGDPPDGRIAPADLWIRLVDGRLVLRSRRLGREVLPRLTSAHDYNDVRHPAVYRLLGALQQQGTTGPLAFAWGALDSAPMLPRVASGRLVLSRARWRLGRTRLAALARLDGAARFAAVQRLRDELALPRLVVLAERDHELPLDLDTPLAADELSTLGRTRDAVVLFELFPSPDELLACGPEGRYAHELVVPFVRRAAPCPRPAPLARPAPPPERDVPRRLPPGSSWLYARLYTTPAGADDLLRAVVRPVAAEAQATSAVRRWFFLRYADPDFHLRLRFHGDPDALLGSLLPALRAAATPAFAAGLISRLQLDTYEREIDRYGGPDGIELAECVFHADSEAAVAWIADHAATADDDARWRIALRGVDQLLDDLGLALADKDRLAAALRDGLQRQLRADATLLRAIGDRFRAERQSLERALDRTGAAAALAPGLAVLDRRSAALRPIVDELRHRERNGRLTRPIAELARSHVHLSVNRLARARAVEQELVLYSFLARLYRARIARGDTAITPS